MRFRSVIAFARTSWRVMDLPVIVMALVVSTAASADLKELDGGHFQCEAPGGEYFNHEITPLGVNKPVTVRFRLISEHANPTWLEQSAVYFEAPGGRMRVQVGKADNDTGHMYVALLNDSTNDSEIVDQYPVTSEWIDVGLTLGSNGVVRVASRNQSANLDLGTTLPIKTELHCHSGVFEMRVLRP